MYNSTAIQRFNKGVYKVAYPQLWNAGGMVGRYLAKRYRNKRRGGVRGAVKPYVGYRSNINTGHNRIVSRKRRRSRYRRRKLRYGTRVRKHALGLFEGKRYGVADTETSVPVNTVKRYRPMIQMVTNVAPAVGSNLGTVTISKKLRQGMKIFVRGIRITMHIRNEDTANPVDVRIICGWRRKSPAGAELVPEWPKIFRKRSTTEEPIAIGDTTEALNMPMATMNIPLATSSYFVCHKDMVVRLGVQGGVGSDDQGAGFKIVNIWWELNNRINKLETDDTLPANTDAEKIMNWFPCVYFYHTDPSNAIPSAAVTYKMHSTVYWKDPLG